MRCSRGGFSEDNTVASRCGGDRIKSEHTGIPTNPMANEAVVCEHEKDNKSAVATHWLWDKVLSLASHWELATIFLYELRSFLYRMGEMRRLGLYRSGLAINPPSQLALGDSPQFDRCSLARRWDTQRFSDLQMQGAESMADAHIFLRGWDRGAEWGLAEHSLDSCSQTPQSQLNPLAPLH